MSDRRLFRGEAKTPGQSRGRSGSPSGSGEQLQTWFRSAPAGQGLRLGFAGVPKSARLVCAIPGQLEPGQRRYRLVLQSTEQVPLAGSPKHVASSPEKN